MKKANIIAAIIVATMTIPMAAHGVGQNQLNTVGDVNRDGYIDASDASKVLAEYAALSVGKTTFVVDDEKLWSDMNADGKIDASDATQILVTYAYNSTNDEPALPIYGYYMVETTKGGKQNYYNCKTFAEADVYAYDQKELDVIEVLRKNYTIRIYRCSLIYISPTEFYENRNLVSEDTYINPSSRF